MRETLILRSSSGIPARGLQPLVKLILIQDPSSARLGGWDGAVLQFHVHRSPGDVRVLDGLFHSHWLMAVLLYGFTTLYLLSGQHGSHAHHLIPKLGDDLWEVVERKWFITYIHTRPFSGIVLQRNLVTNRRASHFLITGASRNNHAVEPCFWLLFVDKTGF